MNSEEFSCGDGVRFRFKLVFSVAIIFLMIISLLVGWSLYHLRLGIGLRNETGYIQEKLDDVIETIQTADNAFLLFKLSRNQSIYQSFLRSIQEANLEINELLLLNQNTPDVLSEVLILKDMMMDKVDFSRRIIFHNEFGETPKLKEIMTVRDDLLMTNQIRDRINKIDGLVVRKLHAHQNYVDTYYGFIFFLVCFCLVGAGIFFAIFAKLVGNEIDRRARLETHLRQAEETAVQASDLKSQFLATISHEIRTPLNGILGMSDLISSRANDKETVRYSGIIHTSGKTLLRIVNDILDFSKIEANKLQIEIQEAQLSRLVESAVELFARKAEEKKLGLVAYYPPNLRNFVAVDSTRVLQVCQNLIGNAVKFTDKGQVEISAVLKPAIDEWIFEFQVRDSGPGIPIDKRALLFQPFVQLPNAKGHEGTGLGLSISQRLIKSMSGEIGFESKEGVGSTFYFRIPVRQLRVESAAAVPAELGGAVFVSASSRKSIQYFFQHFCKDRGVEFLNLAGEDNFRQKKFNARKVWLWMEVGQEANSEFLDFVRSQDGTISTLEIPSCLTPEKILWQTSMEEAKAPKGGGDVVNSPLATEHVGPTTPLPATPRGNILLVEDNSTNQILAETHLRMQGFQVQVANSGEECLQILEEQKFDLIFMDCRMPRMDGYQTSQRIRAGEVRRKMERTPIIALTANAMTGEKNKCLASGMDDYLTKPLDPQELRLMMDQRFPQNLGRDEESSIDWQVLLTLEKKTNPDVVRRLRSAFLDNLDKFMGQMALMAQDAEMDQESLLQIVHPLKSSAAAVGAGELSLMCASLEQKLESGGEAVPTELTNLHEMCEKVQRSLKTATQAG